MQHLDFFEKVNESLIGLERILEKEIEELINEKEYLNIFIIGLPRSGTTLLAQTIFYNMDVLCTNNLMARFWRVPLVGAMLSRFLIGKEKRGNYSSTLGTTEFLWEPHEFSWFWHDILNITSFDFPLNVNSIKKHLDWDLILKKIKGINIILDAAVVHKPLELVGYFLEEFVKHFDNSLFIFIKRNLLEVAVSLARARLKKFGTLNSWWSSYPPLEDFLLIKDKPWYVQIAGQVWFLWRMYQEKLSIIPKNQLISTSYKNLCNSPLKLLKAVERKAFQLGHNLKIINDPPLQFQYSMKSKEDLTLINKLKEGFKIVEDLR